MPHGSKSGRNKGAHRAKKNMLPAQGDPEGRRSHRNKYPREQTTDSNQSHEGGQGRHSNHEH